MCRRRNCQCFEGATIAPETYEAPYQGMTVLNGFLQASPSRHAPTTDLNTAPHDFQHYVNASGFTDVQLNNGMHRKILTGLKSPALLAQANFLSTVVPIIPGQSRQGGHGGFQPKGIDPQSYAALVQSGPGSQPVNPGGPGKIAADYYVNPYAGGG
jgi:hypothetical protein